MKIGGLDSDTSVIIIAEIGNNHEGNAGLAERMIAAAAAAGADAVKFQTLRADRLVGNVSGDRLAMLKSFELSYDTFEHLKSIADNEGVVFLSTPFDLESAAFLNEVVPAFKIASGDISFLPLLRAIAGYNKPILMSRGAADSKRIAKAVETVRERWTALGFVQELALLHCVAMYPADDTNANLSAIPQLSKQFAALPGYSDHTLGIDAPVLSVAFGARIVEKHFTLDHDQSDFRDHKLAADPEEFRAMVQAIRKAETLIGKGTLEPEADEAEGGQALRRSICAGTDLPAETIICDSHLTWLRPEGGLEPGEEEAILGRRLKAGMKQGEAFELRNLI